MVILVSLLSENSEVIIDVDAPRYVRTKILDKAVEVLEEKGLVVLCGPPGAGKTTLAKAILRRYRDCLLYTSPSPRDVHKSRMPSSA